VSKADEDVVRLSRGALGSRLKSGREGETATAGGGETPTNPKYALLKRVALSKKGGIEI